MDVVGCCYRFYLFAVWWYKSYRNSMLRHDTTGRQALLFFPGRRRSGRGHCGRRSRDEAQIGPKEVKASKRQRLQRERLQIIFVHLFFCSHHFWSLRISQIFMENHLNHLDKRLSQPSGCYGCSKMCNFSLYFSYFSHFDWNDSWGHSWPHDHDWFGMAWNMLKPLFKPLFLGMFEVSQLLNLGQRTSQHDLSALFCICLPNLISWYLQVCLCSFQSWGITGCQTLVTLVCLQPHLRCNGGWFWGGIRQQTGCFDV